MKPSEYEMAELRIKFSIHGNYESEHQERFKVSKKLLGKHIGSAGDSISRILEGRQFCNADYINCTLECFLVLPDMTSITISLVSGARIAPDNKRTPTETIIQVIQSIQMKTFLGLVEKAGLEFPEEEEAA